MIDEAVETAISSPLLETTVAGAGTILINVSGGYNIGLLEVNKAVSRIEEIAGEDAMIYFGTNFREDMEDEIVITLIATGFDEEKEDQYVVPDALKEEKSESEESEKGENNRQTLSDVLKDLDEGVTPSEFEVPKFLK